MDETDIALQALKEQMTEQQRQDMADLLKAELIRREKEKMSKGMPKMKSSVQASGMSSGLGVSDIGGMYADSDQAIRELRVRKLEREIEEAKRQQQRIGRPAPRKIPTSSPLGQMIASPTGISLPKVNLKGLAVISVLVLLSGLKVVFSTGVVDAAMSKQETPPAESMVRAATSATAATVTTAPVQSVAPGNWSEVDKRLLTSLDARRVELEKRSSILDKREEELQLQTQALNDKLAELRGLNQKLSEFRKEKDQRYEARMEQLANVYGSMSPNEAAPLLAKLDDEIGLALLERMPGKRMGQILGLMTPDRAIEFTRILSDKGKL